MTTVDLAIESSNSLVCQLLSSTLLRYQDEIKQYNAVFKFLLDMIRDGKILLSNSDVIRKEMERLVAEEPIEFSDNYLFCNREEIQALKLLSESFIPHDAPFTTGNATVIRRAYRRHILSAVRRRLQSEPAMRDSAIAENVYRLTLR